MISLKMCKSNIQTNKNDVSFLELVIPILYVIWTVMKKEHKI